MTYSAGDRKYMRAALRDAKIAAAVGEIPVGAVLVRNDEIIAAGHNRSVQDSDPTAHAEIVALRAAGHSAKNHRLTGTTMYVTLEPCAMCVGAMLQARVSRVVFGAYDEKSGAAGTVVDLTAVRQFNHSIEVNGGLLEDQCAGLLQKFFAGRR
jgi:tRNA(adenine34) deaminase